MASESGTLQRTGHEPRIHFRPLPGLLVRRSLLGITVFNLAQAAVCYSNDLSMPFGWGIMERQTYLTTSLLFGLSLSGLAITYELVPPLRERVNGIVEWGYQRYLDERVIRLLNYADEGQYGTIARYLSNRFFATHED